MVGYLQLIRSGIQLLVIKRHNETEARVHNDFKLVINKTEFLTRLIY